MSIKFHKRLMIIVCINVILGFLFSFFLDKYEGDRRDHSAVGINMGIGWIFWLGIFTTIAPQILSDEDKKIMFRKPYLVGTFVLLFITLISTILTSYFAAGIVLN